MPRPAGCLGGILRTSEDWFRRQEMIRLSQTVAASRNSGYYSPSIVHEVASSKSLKMASDEWDSISLAELDSLEMRARKEVAKRRTSATSFGIASTQSSQASTRGSSSSSPFSSPQKLTRLTDSTAFFSSSPDAQKKVPVKVYQDVPGKIAVETHYNPAVVAALKVVAGHEWNQQRKLWTFPMANAQQLGIAISSVIPFVSTVTVVPPLTLDLPAIVCSSVLQQGSPLKASGVLESSPRKVPGTPEKTKTLGNQIKVEIAMSGVGCISARSPYNEKLKAAYQSIAGKKWDPANRVWTYPSEQLPALILALKQLSPPPQLQVELVPPLEMPKNLENATSPQTHLEFPPPAINQNDLQPQTWDTEHSWATAARPQTAKTSCSIKFAMFNMDQIAARFDYQQDIVVAMRTIPHAQWEPKEKVWAFPSSSWLDAVRILRSVNGVRVQIEAEPPLEVPPDLGDNLSSVDCAESSAAMAIRSPYPTEPELTSLSHKRRLVMDDTGTSSRGPCFVTLMPHASGQIAAKFEYQQDVTAALRSIPNAEWDSKERSWMFPISSLAAAEKKLKDLDAVNVKLTPLQPLVHRALLEVASLPNLEANYDRIPKQLEVQLMPFQRDGVRFALQHGGRVLIGDEMGLGKTLQAIAIASCFREEWPVLVVVPSSLRIHWASMLKQWLGIRPSDITVVMSSWGGTNSGGFNIVPSAGKVPLRLKGSFIIVSYDIIQKLVDSRVKMDFRIIIADESHYMKNAKAKRTIACVPLLQKAKYAILLTGTPALSRPIELFKQLEALQPNVYQEVSDYGNRYCQGSPFGIWQGASQHEELHALLKSTVMIRRLKRDVITQLPRKRRQQVFLTVDEKKTKQLQALFSQLNGVKETIVNHQGEDINKLKFAEKNLITKIYAESAVAKVSAVQEYLTTVVEADCKFLIFGHHMTMLDGIQEFLEKKKVEYIRIDGSTPAASRHGLVEKFQNDGNIKAAVLGIRAAGLGLTLTAASTVIFAEMSWNPGDLVQAEDRAHRIGQESAVNVYYLHAHDSIDSMIWDIVQHKLENLGQVLDGQEETLQIADDPRPRHSNIPSSNFGIISPQRQGTLDAFLRPCNNRVEV